MVTVREPERTYCQGAGADRRAAAREKTAAPAARIGRHTNLPPRIDIFLTDVYNG